METHPLQLLHKGDQSPKKFKAICALKISIRYIF
jgi:hypothetical protein